MKGYYFITDSELSRAGNASDVRNAVAGRRGGGSIPPEGRFDLQPCLPEADVLRKLCRRTALHRQ